MIAFNAEFKRSIRARKCRVISTLEICLPPKCAASSPMERVCSIVTVFGKPYSMTRGTTYSPDCTLGAFFWYFSWWSVSETTSGRSRWR